MWWLQEGTSLVGRFGSTDSLADLECQGCVSCDARFSSITLHLDDLAFVDSAGFDQLAHYCSDFTRSGAEIGILTQRSGLRRLVSRSGLASLLRSQDLGALATGGTPHTCPHRLL